MRYQEADVVEGTSAIVGFVQMHHSSSNVKMFLGFSNVERKILFFPRVSLFSVDMGNRETQEKAKSFNVQSQQSTRLSSSGALERIQQYPALQASSLSLQSVSSSDSAERKD